ncbi:hypothetical protein GX586_03105 [bacterium]|nr:hypothetical protein [bacterium]
MNEAPFALLAKWQNGCQAAKVRCPLPRRVVPKQNSLRSRPRKEFPRCASAEGAKHARAADTVERRTMNDRLPTTRTRTMAIPIAMNYEP